MPAKYFAVIDMLFRQQNDWVMKNTTETLTRIGKQAGLSQQAVEDCLKDQALLDKIAADQKFAAEVLKVNSTPTFFINGEKIKGETSFEEFDKRIKSLLEELIFALRKSLIQAAAGNLRAKASTNPLQNPWEKPAAAVALRPRPRHCRGHQSRKKRLAHTPTLPSMVLSRQGDSRPANRASCP